MDHSLKTFSFLVSFFVFFCWWREHEFLVCMSSEHHEKSHPQWRKWVTTPDQICAILFCGETTAKIHSKPWDIYIFQAHTIPLMHTDTCTPKTPKSKHQHDCSRNYPKYFMHGCVVEQCLWTIYAYHDLNKNKSTALMFIYHFGTINNHFVRMLNSISVIFAFSISNVEKSCTSVLRLCVLCAMWLWIYQAFVLMLSSLCVRVARCIYSFFGQIHISGTRI